jgi:uncharacterized FAD-dependent dehydrogenase
VLLKIIDGPGCQADLVFLFSVNPTAHCRNLRLDFVFQDKNLAAMQKTITIKLLPREAADSEAIKTYIAQVEAVKPTSISGFNIVKQSIDARGKQPWINLTVQAFIDEPYQQRGSPPFIFKNVTRAPTKVLIVGAGPAGLFAALKLIEAGIKPVIIERGKDVRARRRDLAQLNKEGEVNPESNYCFGEGGAGTYSDGKLYTRSSKRGDINRILHLFVHFGAEEKILYESHPHIGTNKLPQIITSMRQTIVDCGGEIHFEKKMISLTIKDGLVHGITTAAGESIEADAFILATGHSARDIFELLHAQNILVEAKPFALGVRVEHSQSLIDAAQYHLNPLQVLPASKTARSSWLPPASYSLVHQAAGKGVFSFCMCPGGIIAPAATSPGELVVNGWSPSKRNNPYANSGIVVTVEEKDASGFFKKYSPASLQKSGNDPLLLMKFQQWVEQAAFNAGGGHFVAPAQRLIDFTQSRVSSDLPECSYLPGTRSAKLEEVLPSFINTCLQEAFLEFGKKMKGYLTNEAIVVATESRTSSPVRIPRDAERLCHPQLKNFYPCGEGAGYAGGIVSAAMDGERIAGRIIAIAGQLTP